MAFNFNTSSFGASSTNTAPTFSFGSSTQPKTAFSFGSTPATTQSSMFGFGNTTSSTTGFGTTGTGFGSSFGTGFGSTTSTPQFSFSTPASTTQPIFSGFGQTQPSTGFGGFGTKPAGSTTFGGFGTGTTPSFSQGFGQPAAQPQPVHPNEALLMSVYKCNVFGDERDQILANWNLLQAFWGSGKGYYAQNAPPFEYTPQNILCGLKTVGYSVKLKAGASEALVSVSINKKPEEIRNQQLQFESSINAVLGNKPNVTVHVDRVVPAPQQKSLVLIYVQEKIPNGNSRRIPNHEICSYLMQTMQKQQLVNMGIDNIYPYMAPSEEQIKEYLENPPAGIDGRIWKQAQLDNPNKDEFIPVPVIGFDDVLWRVKCQGEQSKLHEGLLDGIAEDISNMQKTQLATNVKLTELKKKTLELEHRVLKLMVKLSHDEMIPFGPEEERMKCRLENVEFIFNKQNGIKDQISHILTTLRFHDVSNEKRYECDIDDNTIADIQEYLALEQKAIGELKEILHADMNDMKNIDDDMKKLQAARSV